MAEVASAYVSLLPSAKGFGRKLDSEIGTDLDRAGSTGGKRFGSQFGSMLKSTMGPAIAVLGAAVVGGFLKGAVGEASDLNETLNKSRVIFGTNASAIEAWGKTASKNLGLSKNEAISAAAGFGDMFSQLGFAAPATAKMSKSVVQLAADLGSFNNLDTADVTDRLAAAFRGEYDSLQAIIPNINAARVEQQAMAMTGKNNAKSLTAQEKAAATLAIVQKDGARAQGDFARTSGGLANQQKILSAQAADLKAQIGAALIPIMAKLATIMSTKVMPALTTAISFLKKNPEILIAFGVAVGALAAGFVVAFIAANALIVGIAALVAGVVYAYAKFPQFRAAVEVTFNAIKTVVMAVLPFVIAYIKGWINVIVGVFRLVKAVLTGDWKGAWAAIKQIVSGVTASIKAVISGWWTGVKALFRLGGAAIVSLVKAYFGMLRGAASAGISKLIDLVKSIPGKIKSGLGNLGSMLYDAGRELINGLINGIKSKIGDVGSAMKAIAGKIKGFLPGSPVKEGPLTSWNNGGAGKRLIEMGIIDGVISRKGAVSSAMNDLTSGVDLKRSVSVPAGARFSGDGTSRPAGGSTPTIEQKIYPQPGQSEQEIGRAAANRLLWAMT